MNCSHCGTPLPAGALFCGECGRRAATKPAAPQPKDEASAARTVQNAAAAPELQGPPRRSATGAFGLADALAGAVADTGPGGTFGRIDEHSITGPPPAETASTDADAGATSDQAKKSSGDADDGPPLCAQCGATMALDDIFCEECGFVSSAVTAAFTGAIPTLSAPIEAVAPAERAEAPEPVELPEPELPEPELPEPELPEPELPESAEWPESADRVPFMPAPPTDSRPIPLQPPAGTPVPLPTMPMEVLPPGTVASDPTASGDSDHGDSDHEDSDHEDTEVTRIVQRKPAAERFVLQFSTGESVTVSGTGLIGRNPRPEPGEFFDHVVRVLDSGRSVSKTHLEFGQENGAFWILDRFSGNGSVVRNPESEPVRCESGKRFRVARGSRVEIGEQFFVVS